RLRDRPVAGPAELLRTVAFAPQFSIAHGKLTVGETIDTALRLYRKNHDTGRRDALLRLVGLDERADTLVEKLSGGQLRRLGLALELTTDPACLLCDEVTSGLDPRSEDQILAVLRTLVAEHDRTIVCVIHNLAKLTQFDTVTVVYEGRVVFQGTHPELLAHFNIADALTLYDRLAEHPVGHWLELDPAAADTRKISRSNSHIPPSAQPVIARPSAPAQVGPLLARRLRLLRRDRGYLALAAAITFGFPCLVVHFA